MVDFVKNLLRRIREKGKFRIILLIPHQIDKKQRQIAFQNFFLII